jgi:Zn-dependent protease with chaperone function
VSSITLGFQAIILITPALFSLLYSFIAFRGGFESEDYPTKRWAVAQRCGNVAFFCWCIYLAFTWVILNRIEILDFTSAGLLSEISFRLFAISIGVVSILPLIGSFSLYMLVFGWADRRTRKDPFSLLSYLRLSLAIWLWSSNRLLLIVALIMSQTFFFTFDGKSFGINIVASILILSSGFLVFSYSFPISLRMFRLSVPLDNPQLRSKADNFAQELGVTVKRLFRLRTFDIPIANAFASSNGDIHLSDRVLDSFEAEETEAVLAHEVAHLPNMKKYAHVRLAFSFIFLFLALGVFPLAFWSVPDIRYVFVIMVIGGSCMLWLVSKEKEFQRKCETQADAVAASLTGSEAYVKAFALLHSINLTPVKFSEREGQYLTHPSFEERVNNISNGGRRVTGADGSGLKE